MITTASERPEIAHLRLDGAEFTGELAMPSGACGVVLFAHATGNSHRCPGNRVVAHLLHGAGIGTLVFDLLTRSEEADAGARFDIALLTRRLLAATAWLQARCARGELPFGYFGASTGAAAALCASAQRPAGVRAVACRSARPDLVEATLPRVTMPTLLIVGGWDDVVLQLNREAFPRLHGEKRLEIVPHATHRFEEPGALEEAASLAAGWFARHFRGTEVSTR
jgi:putative phosphoribosyl transferase